MGLRDMLFEEVKSLRDKLGEVINGSYSVQKNDNNTMTTTDTPNIVDRIMGQHTTTQTIDAPKPDPAQPAPLTKIDKSNLVFKEFGNGDGIPHIQDGANSTPIDKVNFTPPDTQKIKSISISDPRKGFSQEITDPHKLAVANEIKKISDAVAPEYTDYLLRLASYEGKYDPHTVNDNGVKGIDRGVFQINNKAFPQITDQMAKDVKTSTLWALSLIQSGKQHKWVADPYVKDAKTNIQYE